MRIYIKFVASQDKVKSLLTTFLCCRATLLPFNPFVSGYATLFNILLLFFSTDGFSMNFSNLIKKLLITEISLKISNFQRHKLSVI